MPSKSQFLWMYEVMEKARYYEDTIAVAYMEGKRPSSISVPAHCPARCISLRDRNPVQPAFASIYVPTIRSPQPTARIMSLSPRAWTSIR